MDQSHKGWIFYIHNQYLCIMHVKLFFMLILTTLGGVVSKYGLITLYIGKHNYCVVRYNIDKREAYHYFSIKNPFD